MRQLQALALALAIVFNPVVYDDGGSGYKPNGDTSQPVAMYVEHGTIVYDGGDGYAKPVGNPSLPDGSGEDSGADEEEDEGLQIRHGLQPA